MKVEDIKELATLAKLELTEQECASYTDQLSDILLFIEKIKEVSSDDDSGRIESAGVRNVLRDDESVLVPGTYTDALLAEMPETENGYNKVKKIL